jgi:hypothetical protein
MVPSTAASVKQTLILLVRVRAAYFAPQTWLVATLQVVPLTSPSLPSQTGTSKTKLQQHKQQQPSHQETPCQPMASSGPPWMARSSVPSSTSEVVPRQAASCLTDAANANKQAIPLSPATSPLPPEVVGALRLPATASSRSEAVVGDTQARVEYGGVSNVSDAPSLGHHHPIQSSAAPVWSSTVGCDGVGHPASAPRPSGLSMQGCDLPHSPLGGGATLFAASLLHEVLCKPGSRHIPGIPTKVSCTPTQRFAIWRQQRVARDHASSHPKFELVHLDAAGQLCPVLPGSCRLSAAPPTGLLLTLQQRGLPQVPVWQHSGADTAATATVMNSHETSKKFPKNFNMKDFKVHNPCVLSAAPQPSSSRPGPSGTGSLHGSSLAVGFPSAPEKAPRVLDGCTTSSAVSFLTLAYSC